MSVSGGTVLCRIVNLGVKVLFELADVFFDICYFFGKLFGGGFSVFLDVAEELGDFKRRLDTFDQAADAGDRADDGRSNDFGVIGDFIDPFQGFFQVFQDADYLDADDGQKNC